MKNRKLISFLLSMTSVCGLITAPNTVFAETADDASVKLLSTSSLYYDGEVKALYHTADSTGEYEIYQANKPVNATYYGGFAFSQFELSDEQLANPVASAEFSCYATGTPGGKYKIGESVFSSADSFSSYASSWLETFGYSGKTVTKSTETVSVNGITYTKFTADFTDDIQSMQTSGEKNVTMALTSSSSAQKMLAYGSEYQPSLTLVYAEDVTPSPTEKPNAVYSVTAKAQSEETVIDTSNMTNSENVSAYLVTVARDGKEIKSQSIERADSVTVTASVGDDIEIAPVYEYPKTQEYGNGITLPDVFPDGRYNITVTNGSTSHTDVYINGYMAANNIDQNGEGRSVSTGSTYTMPDVRVEGGSIAIQTKDSPNSLSYVKVVKSPSIVNAKKKIFITGDSLVADYYGGNENSYLGTTQTGWGQALKKFINTDEYEIVNLSNAGYWASKLQTTAFPGIIYNAADGDIFLLESGVNDYWNPDTTTEGSDSNRTTMKTAVTAMVKGAKNAGLPIILVNPNAQPSRHDITNCFSDVMLEVAEEQNILAIDLARESSLVLSGLYGDSLENIKANFGIAKDNTHSSYLGAMKYASIVATYLYRMGYTDMFDTDYVYEKNDTLGNTIICSVDTTQESIPQPTPTPIPEEEACVKITAQYNTDGSLKSVSTEEIHVSDIEDAVNTDTEKTFYWKSLSSMMPIAVSDYDYKFTFGSDSINSISVFESLPYGEQSDDMTYGFYGISGSPDVSDGRTDGYKKSAADPDTVLKYGEINGKSYVTADYSAYDETTISNMADGIMPVRFSFEAEQHKYYTVEVTLVNTDETAPTTATLYSEKRHTILYEYPLNPGETVTKKFNVNLESVYYNSEGIREDSQLNISVLGKNVGLCSMSVKKHDSMGRTIWLCTDSTGCDQPAYLPYFPLRNYSGTGSALSKYINPEIAVSNQGEGGLSASDSNHFNNAVKYIQEGDYLYVQYGLNDSDTASFKNNLEKYYTTATEKGAYLIVVSPSDRHGSSSWDSTSLTWKSIASGFAAAGKEFVEEKISSGADNVAYIDLNTSFISWMNDETARIAERRQALGFGDTAVSKNAMDYYYLADRTSGIDTIHINDHGTDNAAYLVMQEAKKTVENGQKETASDIEKIQANVLAGLVENMSDLQPSLVSDEIIGDGWAINSHYPYPSGEEVTYTYPTMVKSVDAENGVLNSMTVKVQGNMNAYAQGCADILDADGEVVNTVYTTYTNVNSEIGHIDNTSAKYGDIVVMYFDSIAIPDGGSYCVYLKGKENGAELPGDEYYSSKYYEPDSVVSYLITSADGAGSECFDYGIETGLIGTGANSASGANAWGFAGSSSGKQYNVTEKDGTNCAVLAQNGDGTYTLCKYFNNYEKVSDGKIKLHFQINYTYGSFTMKLLQSSKIASWVDGLEILRIADSEVLLCDGTSAGKIKTSKWTDIDVTLDIDRGISEISIAGGEPVSCNVEKLQTSSWSDTELILPIKGIAVTYTKNPSTIPSYPFEFYITDLLVTSVETTTPQVTVTTVSDSETGTVTGSGVYDINSDITITAVPNDGYAFTGWYNGDTLYSEDAECVLEKVREDITLTAEFAVQKSKEETASFDISADKSAVKYTSSVQLTPVNAKDENGYSIGNLTAEDIAWSSDETGVIINNGMVSFDDTFEIDENTTKTVTITGIINDVTQTYDLTVYSYAYYEIIDSSVTDYDGEFLTIADKESIIFPNATLTQVYTLSETVSLDKATTITYNNAWSGPNGDGKNKTLSFCDSQGNTVFSVYYQWDGIYVGGEVIWKAVKKDTWQPITIEIDPETGVVSVTAVSTTLTTTLNGSEIASIKFTSASGVSSDRELGICDIVISQ